mgnify:CR=1 FL=1
MYIRTQKVAILFILLFVMTSMLSAWEGFSYVIAEAHDSGVRVSWQSKDEGEVKYYEIYRSRAESTILEKRASVTALGMGASYVFQDDNMFSKSSESSGYSFDYYVRAVMKDGSYSNSAKKFVALAHLGVSQQTWGSIKAMFR